MTTCFSHEKLRVYGDSIRFVAWSAVLLDRIPKHLSAWDQLDRAAASMPLNIAQGNGKFTAPDRCRFFDTARGSALECAARLDVLLAKTTASEADCASGKGLLHGVVSMLVGLIRSNSPERIHEDRVEYRARAEGCLEKPTAVGPISPRVFLDHERLQVYQQSLSMILWSVEAIRRLPAGCPLVTKLDRASTAIPLNIAEGNGKFTAPDRCRFFDNAHSSALECAACLDTLVAKKSLAEAEIEGGKKRLETIVSMLIGLIRSNSADRLLEEQPEYRVPG